MRRSPACTRVIATPDARATPAVSASRLVAAALLFGAVVQAEPGMLEEVAAAEGELPAALLALLDCVNEYEALIANTPVRPAG